jgi:hypothetical protein
MKQITIALALLLMAAPAAAQHVHPSHAAMEARGAKAMGFDQSKATHHFVLTADGGRIEIAANDPKDAATRARVAAHLEHITTRFRAGDFSIPHETHGELPRGAAEMAALRSDIDYTYDPSADGGHMRIAARSAKALGAAHEFLRYQIQEHKTGDPLTVRR